MNRVRFYIDENVSNEIADGLRTRGIDVLTTAEADKLGAEDTDQLAFALNENRVIVTQDNDFLKLDHQGVTHAGIAYWKSQSRTVKWILRRLMAIHYELSPKDMQNHIEFL